MNLAQKTIADMLKDAGYKICVTGKWQFDGGDLSIHTFGFDDYAVWYPFNDYNNDNTVWSRYKNPAVRSEGSFRPTSLKNGKYSKDVFMDHLSGFMENKVNNNFFAYCSMVLPHEPFNPTPDDPKFATFNPETDSSDIKYFPSMIAYMDKKVGQLIARLKSSVSQIKP